MSAKQNYLNGLPKKVSGAGALFCNVHGHVLILQPSYKKDCEIPGGIVESMESPKTAAEREIQEEIGLSIKLQKILCIDYRVLSEDIDSYQIIFDGGTLSDEQISNIKIPKEEIASYAFVDKNMAFSLLGDIVGPRLKIALEAKDASKSYYLEHGKKID